MGVGYASWTDGFEINTSISIAKMKPVFSDNYSIAGNNPSSTVKNGNNILPNSKNVTMAGDNGTVPFKFDGDTSTIEVQADASDNIPSAEVEASKDSTLVENENKILPDNSKSPHLTDQQEDLLNSKDSLDINNRKPTLPIEALEDGNNKPSRKGKKESSSSDNASLPIEAIGDENNKPEPDLPLKPTENSNKPSPSLEKIDPVFSSTYSIEDNNLSVILEEDNNTLRITGDVIMDGDNGTGYTTSLQYAIDNVGNVPIIFVGDTRTIKVKASKDTTSIKNNNKILPNNGILHLTLNQSKNLHNTKGSLSSLEFRATGPGTYNFEIELPFILLNATKGQSLKKTLIIKGSITVKAPVQNSNNIDEVPVIKSIEDPTIICIGASRQSRLRP